MTIEQERADLRTALQENSRNIFTHEAGVPALDMRVQHKRRVQTDYYDYEEWKIEYTAETPERMPIPAGQRVSAYLLVPGQQSVKEPFPAMICFHQCNVDCPLGKESVVGKVSYRPDQAYGLELVTEGFVVLAPDSINCGERYVPGVRDEGAGTGCTDDLSAFLGRQSWDKHIQDNTRAVDLLESLDFVDSDRIGAIGHSMGQGDARDVMGYDPRVKACIVSSATAWKYLPLHSPRLHVALRGLLDGKPENIEEVKASYDSARRFYEADGAAENLVLRILNCGHHFVDEFKWEAYTRLRRYFRMDEGRKAVSLNHVLKTAWGQCWACGKMAYPGVQITDRIRVIADEVRLIEAFDALFIALNARKPGALPVIEVKEDQSTIYTIYRVLSQAPQDMVSARVSHENYQRRANQLFIGTGASVRQEVMQDALQYTIALPRAS